MWRVWLMQSKGHRKMIDQVSSSGAAVSGLGQRYPLIIVDADCVARIASEGERAASALGAVLARSAPPVSCGPEMPNAPARGPMIQFAPREMSRSASGGVSVSKIGYMGRDAARIADAFDLMTLQSYRQHPRTVAAAEAAHPAKVDAMRVAHDARQADLVERGQRRARPFVEPEFVPPVFVPPFDNGQVQAGRAYAALVERVAGSGIKCSSLEAVSGGSGGGGDREAAILQDVAQLRAMQRRFGNRLAKEVRRIRPNGVKRRTIFVRQLVDMVCLGDASLDDVLRAHGWALNQKTRDGLRVALCVALDRMCGYDLANPK